MGPVVMAVRRLVGGGVGGGEGFQLAGGTSPPQLQPIAAI